MQFVLFGFLTLLYEQLFCTKNIAAARKMEIIKTTECVLNALNQGDYESYARLCDPHMSSFEPETLGQLVDNMQFRRLCLDQATQLQIQQNYTQQQRALLLGQQTQTHHAQSHTQPQGQQQQQVASGASASSPTNKTENHNKQQQQQQVAATSAALASLSLGSVSSLGSASASHLVRQYSVLLNPQVYLLGEDAASIAYTNLSQFIDLQSGQLISVERSEETRVWHRRDGKSWLCVHLHRSNSAAQVGQQSGGPIFCRGPQTSLSFLRSVASQQQQLNTLALLQQQRQQLQQQVLVPTISLSQTTAPHHQQNTASDNATASSGSHR